MMSFVVLYMIGPSLLSFAVPTRNTARQSLRLLAVSSEPQAHERLHAWLGEDLVE